MNFLNSIHDAPNITHQMRYTMQRIQLLNFSIFDKEIEKKRKEKKISFEEKLAIHYPLSFCATINLLTCKFLIKKRYITIYNTHLDTSPLCIITFVFAVRVFACRFCFRSTAQFSTGDCVCRVLFPPLSTTARSIKPFDAIDHSIPAFFARETHLLSIPTVEYRSDAVHEVGEARRGEGRRRKQEKRTRRVERRETTKEKFPFLQGKRSDVSCPRSDSEESVSRPFSNRVFPCN